METINGTTHDSAMDGSTKKWAENQAACALGFPTPPDKYKEQRQPDPLLYKQLQERMDAMRAQEEEQRRNATKPLTSPSDFQQGRYRPADPINPAHYRQGGVECIDAIASALGADGYSAYLRGQVLKYLWRGPHKGSAHQDYQKAEWYLQRLIQVTEKSASGG
jgi:hypothetical protein